TGVTRTTGVGGGVKPRGCTRVLARSAGRAESRATAATPGASGNVSFADLAGASGGGVKFFKGRAGRDARGMFRWSNGDATSGASGTAGFANWISGGGRNLRTGLAGRLTARTFGRGSGLGSRISGAGM